MSSHSDTTVLDDCEVIHTTARAILVRINGNALDATEIWIPRSVVEGGDFIEEGDTDIEVQDWWAAKNDLT